MRVAGFGIPQPAPRPQASPVPDQPEKTRKRRPSDVSCKLAGFILFLHQPTSEDEEQHRRAQVLDMPSKFVLGACCSAVVWRACRAATGRPSSRASGCRALAPFARSAHAQRFSLRHSSPQFDCQAPGHLASPTTALPPLHPPFTTAPLCLHAHPDRTARAAALTVH